MKFRWETEFKDTEIGEIPKDWEVTNLKHVIKDLETGNRPKGGATKHNPLGILSIGGENITWKGELVLDNCLRFDEKFYKNLKKGKIEEQDILLVKDGATIGKIAFIKEIPEGKAMVNEHVFLIKTDRTKYNQRFLFYFLFSQIGQTQIENCITGSAQGGINKGIADNIKIVKFNHSEQSRIANVLSWFDDLIENKKRQNKILEKVAMALFKNWFIDFEPFKNEEFVYNEDLGKEIPKGWDVDFINKLIDFDPAEGLVRNRIYTYIEMKHVSVSSMCCEYEFKKMSGSGSKFRFGDTLLAKITPCLENGKTAFVWFLDPNQVGFGSTEFIVMRGKKDFLMEFTYLLARTDDFREFAINSMSGTSGRQRVEKEALKLYKIVIPPPPILQSFHSLVEPIFQKIILNQKQIMLLRKIRDRLLPLLVFGKLRVEEI